MNVYAAVQLIRPSNFLLAVASVFVAAILAGGTDSQLPVMITVSLAAGFIGAGGMIINDIFDVEIDRINKPARPLPSGAISITHARILYVFFSLAGVVLNLFTSAEAFGIAAAAVPLIFLYSSHLKKRPLSGNAVVAFLTGLAFIYGAAGVGGIDRAIIPALFAFLINLAREIVKDMEDVDGDRVHGAETLPVIFGKTAARNFAIGAMFLVIVSTFIPLLFDIYGIWFYGIVVPGVDCVLAVVIVLLMQDTSTRTLGRVSAILKYIMVIGLIGIAAG